MVYNYQQKIKILQKPLKYGTLHQSILWLWLPTTELTQKLYCQIWQPTEAPTPPQPPNLDGQEVGCKGCTVTTKGCLAGGPRPGPCPPPRGGGLHPAVHASWFLLSKGSCASAGPVGSPPRTVGVWASYRMFPQMLASASTRTPALSSRGRGMHYNGTA